MIRKNIIARAGIVAAIAMCLQTTPANAQDIHFTQFNASPLIVNPAFTGGFSGQYRASAIYRNQWQSVTVPFVTYGISFDAPVVRDLTIDDYLAVGVQLYNDRAGDGNLQNFSGLLSVAYHKFFGANSDKALSFGIQGGYSQKSMDLSKLYFGDELVQGIWMQGTSASYPYLNNAVNFFSVNAGLSWSQSIGENFGYTLGLSAFNLNQPSETMMDKRRMNSDVGLSTRYAAQVGAIAYVGDNFSIRPGLLYQTQATTTELIAGSEFHYILGDASVRSFATGVFVGGWVRPGDAAMITAGMEWKGFRLGLAYDFNTSELKTASNGRGGFEISLRYIAPRAIDFAKQLIYPCARF